MKTTLTLIPLLLIFSGLLGCDVLIAKIKERNELAQKRNEESDKLKQDSEELYRYRSSGFSEDDIKIYRQNNQVPLNYALQCRTVNYTANQCVGWYKLGLSVDASKAWADQGYDPAENLSAISTMKKIGLSPEHAKQWSTSGFSVDETEKLIGGGLSVSEAFQWKSNGFAVDDILSYKKDNTSIEYAIKSRNHISRYCSNGVEDHLSLLSANIYALEGRCFVGIWYEALQFLSKNSALYVIFGNSKSPIIMVVFPNGQEAPRLLGEKLIFGPVQNYTNKLGTQSQAVLAAPLFHKGWEEQD